MSGVDRSPGEGIEAAVTWRTTELDIMGGAAHALNNSLTGLTLAAEMARLGDAASEDALEVIEQQAARLQREVELVFALLALEHTTLQLHNPLEVARSAGRFFQRLPAAIRSDVRITGTADAGAVELDAGPCIRAVVLSMRSFAAAFDKPGTRVLELEVHANNGAVALDVRCDDDTVTPDQDFVDAATDALGPDCGAHLVAADRRVTLMMQTPHR